MYIFSLLRDRQSFRSFSPPHPAPRAPQRGTGAAGGSPLQVTSTAWGAKLVHPSANQHLGARPDRSRSAVRRSGGRVEDRAAQKIHPA